MDFLNIKIGLGFLVYIHFVVLKYFMWLFKNTFAFFKVKFIEIERLYIVSYFSLKSKLLDEDVFWKVYCKERNAVCKLCFTKVNITNFYEFTFYLQKEKITLFTQYVQEIWLNVYLYWLQLTQERSAFLLLVLHVFRLLTCATRLACHRLSLSVLCGNEHCHATWKLLRDE